MLTILGPTATGKTTLAAQLAYHTNGEIISADSRQVYRGMDIGSGKDLEEYRINNKNIPFHLIDIVDPGYEYNVFEFQKDFLKAFTQISANGSEAILCGGTGLYLESVLKGYKLHFVPENSDLRKSLETMPDEELINHLKEFRPLHNTTDITERKRLIRALEIEHFYKQNPHLDRKLPSIPNITFGISFERETLKKKITNRLKARLENGLLDEVEKLLQICSPTQLKFYGLEYKLVTLHLTGQLNYNDMYQKLNAAIHDFAKRQMTWFRKMEKDGIKINWINGELPLSNKIEIVLKKIKAK